MRELLVFPGRDDAEEVAEILGERFPSLGVPRVLRETLAGEDDAEDAQWLVVVEGLPRENLPELDELAGRYEGWRERG